MPGDEIFEIDTDTRRSLGRALDVLGREGPLPVVVVSAPYAHLLENWIAHVHALGIRRFLVVAMDPILATRLAGRGIVTARGVFDGSATDFWLRRLVIWQHLLECGVHVVQSDVDAIWLRDPIPAVFAGQHADVLCSQGTLHPGDVAAQWGFVLCTGLMSIRPTVASRAFFRAFAARGHEVLETDDQAVMNRMLAAKLAWDRHGQQAEVNDLEGEPFDSYAEMIDGRESSTGATFALLPHRLFPRLPTAAAGAFVKHVLRPEDDALRVTELRAVGCWRLGE